MVAAVAVILDELKVEFKPQEFVRRALWNLKA